MNSINHTGISKNLHRIIELRGSPARKEIERMTESAGMKITSTTLGNFLNDPEERSPWVKTILTLAYVLRIEPWMLLVEEFPFEELKPTDKPVKKISAAGYRLLALFESASPEKQQSMLDYVAFQLKDTAGERKIRETQQRYTPNKVNSTTPYPGCNEDFE